MMDIRAFEAELEKLRSGFSFDTTKPCGMYVAALSRAEAAEAERNTAARRAYNAEAENQRLTADNRRLAARVAELEAETTRLRQELEVQQGRVKTLLNRNSAQAARMRARMARAEAAEARVAELESQLAAAHLNPYNTAPLEEHVIVTLRTKGWRDKDGLWDWDDYGDWDVVGWQPLPPPAPDTQEATTP